jgi:hypothetical protein
MTPTLLGDGEIWGERAYRGRSLEMVGRNVFRLCLVVGALLSARSAAADVINFTGNVTTDFSKANAPGATFYTNPSDPSTTPAANALIDGIAPGIFLKDVALDYNAATNTMYVGIQTYGVTGSVDGSSIGTGNGLAVGFAPVSTSFTTGDTPPAPTFVAGDSNVATGTTPTAAGRGTGLDGFNVTTYAGGTATGTMNLLTGFGQTLTAGMGNLAFTPSATTPDYEFTITNFSKLLGADPSGKVAVLIQDGQVNAGSGKGDFIVTYIPFGAQTITPEPTTWLVWAGMAGGLAWSVRRRSRRSPSSRSLACNGQ